jgi:hypothetical protein
LVKFMLATMRRCPALLLESPERTVTCISLAYNIGVRAFDASSVSHKTMRREYQGAADAFLLWNKAGGIVMKGLTLRRKRARQIYLSAEEGIRSNGRAPEASSPSRRRWPGFGSAGRNHYLRGQSGSPASRSFRLSLTLSPNSAIMTIVVNTSTAWGPR